VRGTAEDPPRNPAIGQRHGKRRYTRNVFAALTLLVLAQTAPVSDELNRRGDRDVGGYHLERRDDGGYTWHGPHLTATIAADGRVHFFDERPTPGQAVNPVIAAAGAYKGATRGRNPVRGLLGAITHPTLTLSDEDLRHDTRHGPKMAFLDATAVFRADLRAAFDRKARGGALEGLRQRVRAVAADSRPLPERHRLIFELWQECEDSPSGALARAAIEDEVRRQLPAGTPRAFTAAELTQLNAGQKPPFAPYR
jgi:hypothetical protein